MEQGSQIADSTPNVAEVLSESQDSAPVDVNFPVGDARRNMRPVDEIEKNLQDDMETAGLTRIGGPEGGVGKNQLAKFLSQKGLDQALLGAVGERMTPEPRIGDNSPLIDPATCFIAFICADEPTLETERPTLTAGLIPWKKRSVSRKI